MYDLRVLLVNDSCNIRPHDRVVQSSRDRDPTATTKSHVDRRVPISIARSYRQIRTVRDHSLCPPPSRRHERQCRTGQPQVRHVAGDRAPAHARSSLHGRRHGPQQHRGVASGRERALPPGRHRQRDGLGRRLDGRAPARPAERRAGAENEEGEGFGAGQA